MPIIFALSVLLCLDPALPHLGTIAAIPWVWVAAVAAGLLLITTLVRRLFTRTSGGRLRKVETLSRRGRTVPDIARLLALPQDAVRQLLERQETT